MRPGRVSCLVTALFFSFAVLVAEPVRADEGRFPTLQSIKNFFLRDWENTQHDVQRLGDLIARDFARTRADLAGVRARLAGLKLAFSGGAHPERVREMMGRLHEKLVDRLDATIDEMGLPKFRELVEGLNGAPVLPPGAITDERAARAALGQAFDRAFGDITEDMVRSGPAALLDAAREADGVVAQVARGDTPEQLVQTLRAKHFTSGDATARRLGFWRTLGLILNTLFMVAACGALSLVSLGFMAYGLSSGGLIFSVVGGAAVVGCLYGVVFYIAHAIHELHHHDLQGAALEVAR